MNETKVDLMLHPLEVSLMYAAMSQLMVYAHQRFETELEREPHEAGAYNIICMTALKAFSLDSLYENLDKIYMNEGLDSDDFEKSLNDRIIKVEVNDFDLAVIIFSLQLDEIIASSMIVQEALSASRGRLEENLADKIGKLMDKIEAGRILTTFNNIIK